MRLKWNCIMSISYEQLTAHLKKENNKTRYTCVCLNDLSNKQQTAVQVSKVKHLFLHIHLYCIYLVRISKNIKVCLNIYNNWIYHRTNKLKQLLRETRYACLIILYSDVFFSSSSVIKVSFVYRELFVFKTWGINMIIMNYHNIIIKNR